MKYIFGTLEPNLDSNRIVRYRSKILDLPQADFFILSYLDDIKTLNQDIMTIFM